MGGKDTYQKMREAGRVVRETIVDRARKREGEREQERDREREREATD